MTRDRRIASFLESHGYGSARAEPLPGDAGLRRYVRLSPGPRPALLMDAAPPEDVRPFVRIASHLAAAGICVPEIYAVEPECGLLLEEDLGDHLLAGLIDSSAGDLEPAFDIAIDVLARIHQTEPPPELPRWDAGTMARTALATVFDWWWPAMFGAPAPNAARDEVAIALDTMLAPVAAGPAGFVHRDYFAGNLLWLPQRTGLRRIAVIDFQGAAIGHPAYDLASLLQNSPGIFPPQSPNALSPATWPPVANSTPLPSALPTTPVRRSAICVSPANGCVSRNAMIGRTISATVRTPGHCWTGHSASRLPRPSRPRWTTGSRRTTAAIRRA